MTAIAMLLDSRQAKGGSVVLASLARFLPRAQGKQKVYIFFRGLGDLERKNFLAHLVGLPLEIVLIEVPDVRDDFPIQYWKLEIPHLADFKEEQILFLDADLLIRGDLLSLLNLKLHRKIVGIALDETFSNPSKKVLNSGVMLLNLPSWRRRFSSGQLLDLARREGFRHPYQDQDVLNAVLQTEDICLFGSRWNRIFSVAALRQDWSGDVIHFAGRFKPWKFIWRQNPHWKEYWRIASSIYPEWLPSISLRSHFMGFYGKYFRTHFYRVEKIFLQKPPQCFVEKNL